MNMVLRPIGETGFKVVYRCCQAFCLLHCVEKYIGSTVRCYGKSMEPTLLSNDSVLVERISVRNRTLKKGDIVVAKNPFRPEELICKRLIGLEGDKIYKTFASFYVPKGHIWLEGDNKDNSTDSRDYGPIPYGLLVSKVAYRWWPRERAGSLTHSES